MTLQCCQCSDSDVEMISCKELSTKTPFCRKTCGIATFLFLLYGAVLLALVVKNYAPTSSETLARRCTRLLEPISAKDIMDTIFSGKWILQEAYSSDSIDQSALTHSNSSWAEFTKEPNGTITLHMAHMLTRRNGTPWCVYHHFHNIKLRKNVLLLDLPQFNSSAKIKFRKACNECLVLTAKAFVPGFGPLDYLLAYGLHPELNEYFLRPTREQASCNGLKPPPPFHYKGAEFCPDDDDGSAVLSQETHKMDSRCIFSP